MVSWYRIRNPASCFQIPVVNKRNQAEVVTANEYRELAHEIGAREVLFWSAPGIERIH
jgi:hypothetical protein